MSKPRIPSTFVMYTSTKKLSPTLTLRQVWIEPRLFAVFPDGSTSIPRVVVPADAESERVPDSAAAEVTSNATRPSATARLA
jgi:hypothetical protein